MLSNGSGPRLEIEVVDLDSCAVEVSWKADQAQPTASVVKLLIALDLIEGSGVPSGGEATGSPARPGQFRGQAGAQHHGPGPLPPAR